MAGADTPKHGASEMAGTDRQREMIAEGPAVILVEPQLGENIGMVARAMANFGLADLRLVSPRDGWPNPKAEAAASGAIHVIEGARLFDDDGLLAAELDRVEEGARKTFLENGDDRVHGGTGEG